MLETKRCPRCVTVKPRSQFARNNGRSDGLQPYCRACRADLDHERYEREVGRSVTRRAQKRYAFARRAWLRSLKTGRPCTDCGRIFDPQVMQWDHLPGFEKLGDISGGFPGRTEGEILREIAKCELVCTNCHNIRTFKRNGWDTRSLHETEAPYGETWTQTAVAANEPDDVLRCCAMCGQSKRPTDFHRSRTGQFSYCRDCRCAYDRRYYAWRGKVVRLARQRAHGEIERAWMGSLKKGIPCKDCGEAFPPHVMHWDHLPGHVKLSEIGSMVGSRRRDVILAEMEKCELVCANCHAMRTVVRARRSIPEEDGGFRFEVAV